MVNYLGHADALIFIDECEQRGVRILGMEFFVVGEGTLTPVGVADWTGLTTEESWRESRALLNGGIPDGGNAVEFATDE